MADPTQPEPQKIDLTQPGSKILDPDPSLISPQNSKFFNYFPFGSKKSHQFGSKNTRVKESLCFHVEWTTFLWVKLSSLIQCCAQDMIQFTINSKIQLNITCSHSQSLSAVCAYKLAGVASDNLVFVTNPVQKLCEQCEFLHFLKSLPYLFPFQHLEPTSR